MIGADLPVATPVITILSILFSKQRQDGQSLDSVQNQILVLLRAKSI